MAAGNTVDTRTHVMGDMLMLTGTFTDGGTSVSFDGLLSNVIAAGGHCTSAYFTGILIDNGSGYAAGTTTALTVSEVDARLHFNIGETVYAGALDSLSEVGVITAIGGATSITIGGGTLVALGDDNKLSKFGPDQSAVTLHDGTLAVSINETNSKVIFSNGNLGATSTASINDGRWWILGLR